MSRSVSHWSLFACLVVTFGLSIGACEPNRFAGSVTPVVVPPDASAGESVDLGESVDVPEAGDGGSDEAFDEASDEGSDAGSDMGSASTDSPCVALCAVLAGTGCPPDPAACPAGCEAQIADLCGGESRVLLTCQAGLSPGDFSCDSRSHLVMDPAKCQTESDALVLCLAGL